MLRLPALFSPVSPIESLIRLLAVSAIALAWPVPGNAALCEQIQATEQEVESLRASTPTLKADVAARKQRLENVRSWMPDAEAQQRLAAARTAYVEAKANEQSDRKERRLIESQAGDVSGRKRASTVSQNRSEAFGWKRPSG